jgi:hypothetical protein
LSFSIEEHNMDNMDLENDIDGGGGQLYSVRLVPKDTEVLVIYLMFIGNGGIFQYVTVANPLL